MKITIWEKRNMVIYVGGDPERNVPPEITIEIKEPQIRIDSDKNIIQIDEAK